MHFLFFSREPYASSKYATDVLSIALNERLNKQVLFTRDEKVPSAAE